MTIVILVLLVLIVLYFRSISMSAAVIAKSYTLWEKSLGESEEKHE